MAQIQAVNSNAPQSIINQIKAQWLHVLLSVSHMTAASVWFILIFLAAAGLGWFTGWMAVNWPWVPGWMLTCAHVVEGALVVMDCISLLRSAWKHLFH